MKKIILFINFILLFSACQKKNSFDASGYFEADEVIVSAQQNGELISYSVQEGRQLRAGDSVGKLDVRSTELQKEQIEAAIASLKAKTVNPDIQAQMVRRQLAVQKSQLAQQLSERERTKNLIKADAATTKQLDDINWGIDRLKKQIAVTRKELEVNRSNADIHNRSILSEKTPLQKSAAQVQEQINKGEIINPINGTVLVNFALKGELQSIGKPLYKIANIDVLDLRAYVTGAQLSEIKIGEQVKVKIDKDGREFKQYSGTITSISSKSEFSPKTIQTKDERANLVYAIKVRVKNDGYLKIGMYAEVSWSAK